MLKEQEYAKRVGSTRLKKFGQFFTPNDIAEFMSSWVLQNDGTVFDPAVGNSVFFKCVKKLSCNKRSLEGYEVDQTILDFFGTVEESNVVVEDYLMATWDKKYDCIICNPPYNKFQSIKQRDLVYNKFLENTGLSLTKYTNQYILFLIKALYQLKEGGRLAFIIPSEFLNSKYGNLIKSMLLEDGILRAIVNFQNDKDIFFNSTTTCCIVLVEKSRNHKTTLEFVNIINSSELFELNIAGDKLSSESTEVEYSRLLSESKWLPLMKNEDIPEYSNTVTCSTFMKVSRGIATGDNDYFLFNKNKISKWNIPIDNFRKCISKSMDVKNVFFEETDFDTLYEMGKNVYLLDVKQPIDDSVKKYLTYGEEQDVNKKHLPSHRKPWYSQESKEAPPIWIVSAGRGEIKIVRNLAGIVNLTTFHAVYVNTQFEDFTDVLFCYFLTPIGQEILKCNKKELGGGLDKFQPNDLNDAKMLDIRLLRKEQVSEIHHIYGHMKNLKERAKLDVDIARLNEIFIEFLK